MVWRESVCVRLTRESCLQPELQKGNHGFRGSHGWGKNFYDLLRDESFLSGSTQKPSSSVPSMSSVALYFGFQGEVQSRKSGHWATTTVRANRTWQSGFRISMHLSAACRIFPSNKPHLPRDIFPRTDLLAAQARSQTNPCPSHPTPPVENKCPHRFDGRHTE